MLRLFKQPLAFFSIATSVAICFPIVIIFSSFFSGNFETWQHLASTVLSDYIVNSIWLVLGVSIGVLLLGVPTAWLTSNYDFIGKNFFSWALLLPLAIPAYIIAYTYTGLFDYSGAIQTTIRQHTNWDVSDLWFFKIRTLGGAIVMLSLVLYPYVYMLARTSFLKQPASLIEASQNLGYNKARTFQKIILPLARPAIIAGLTLALMETLADFGTVQFFGVNTFTTGIYRAFYSFGDTAAAAQLSSILLTFVVVLIFLEKYSRRNIKYHSRKIQHTKNISLKGKSNWLAFIVCLVPFCFGFLVPALLMLYWSAFKAEIGDSFFQLAWNSFYLACLAAVLTTFFALLLAYSKRLYYNNKLLPTTINLSTIGYALPGTVIAIGIIVPFSWLDQRLISFSEKFLNIEHGLILSGTIVALLFAYTIRFLAVAFGSVDSDLKTISPNIDYAGRSLGKSSFNILRRIHLPIISSSIFTAVLLVFVDVLKELPATLILRPFNFNTLSIRAYELASDERLIDAAPASLLIVLVGIIPVIILHYSIQNRSA